MKVDAIVVGFGLAGLAVTDQLRRMGKSVVVFDSTKKGASHRAAGVYNPTILKRYTMSWEGPSLLSYALQCYQQLESDLGETFLYPLPIARIFSSASEQNQWSVAADKYIFQKFLNAKLKYDPPPSIKAPFGFGLVENVGRLDIKKLLFSYQNHFLSTSNFIEDTFDYKDVIQSENSILYQHIQATDLIFCEGTRMWNNPFFKDLPLRGSHGDIVRIQSPALDASRIWKAGLFVVPEGDDIYWVGASFNNDHKEALPTQKGRAWVEEKLQQLINVPYTILGSEACIRPTVGDRRPILGTHPRFSRVHLLNGLGSRGVLTAPQMAVHLCNAICNNQTIPEVVSIKRFMSSC